MARELWEESVRRRVYSTFTPPNPPSADNHIKVTITLVSVALLKSRMYVKFLGDGGEPAILIFRNRFLLSSAYTIHLRCCSHEVYSMCISGI